MELITPVLSNNIFMKVHLFPILILGLFLTGPFCYGQDDLLALLEDESGKQITTSVWKGSRVVLGHSTKTRTKGELDFLISHRFGRLNQGAHELFGLDVSFIRLGLEYGITDDFNIGIGRSSFDKTYDAFVKYKFLKQSTGSGSSPVSIVYFGSVSNKTTPREQDDPTYDTFSERLAMTTQFLVSRKMNANLSLQLMPTLVHKNRVEFFDNNSQIAMGVGGRIKVSPGMAITGEYYYRLNVPDASPYKNPISIGVDIETGGHVFQLHFTNSVMTIERSVITETLDDFFDGDIHFGFNISRTFQLRGGEGW